MTDVCPDCGGDVVQDPDADDRRVCSDCGAVVTTLETKGDR